MVRAVTYTSSAFLLLATLVIAQVGSQGVGPAGGGRGVGVPAELGGAGGSLQRELAKIKGKWLERDANRSRLLRDLQESRKFDADIRALRKIVYNRAMSDALMRDLQDVKDVVKLKARYDFERLSLFEGKPSTPLEWMFQRKGLSPYTKIAAYESKFGRQGDKFRAIKVPGFPTKVFDYHSVKRRILADALGMPVAAGYKYGVHMRCVVVFMVKPRAGNLMSRFIVGNGVLVSPTVIVTAGHVARSLVSLGASSIRAMTPPDSEVELDLSRTHFFGSGAFEQPDLAILRTARPVSRSDFVAFSKVATVRTKQSVFGIGAWGYSSSLPNLYEGNVFTKQRRRTYRVARFGKDGRRLKSTIENEIDAFGTSLNSLKGLSGAPLFDSLSGQLIGVVVAGESEFRGYDEGVINAPADPTKWDAYTRWSWGTLISPVRDFLDKRGIK